MVKKWIWFLGVFLSSSCFAKKSCDIYIELEETWPLYNGKRDTVIVMRDCQTGEYGDSIHTYVNIPDWSVPPAMDFPDSVYEKKDCITGIMVTGNYYPAIPDRLKEFKRLNSLEVRSNPITKLPVFLSKMDSLNFISFHNTSLKTIDFNIVSHIETVVFHGSDSLKTLIPPRTNDVGITGLGLTGNSLDSLPPWLNRFKKLRDCGFDWNNLKSLRKLNGTRYNRHQFHKQSVYRVRVLLA